MSVGVKLIAAPAIRVAILASVLALAAQVFAANPYPFFKDSGELNASMANAGIAHPTGFPGQHTVAALAVSAPAGPIAFRLSLVSVAGVTIAFFCAVLLCLLLTSAPRQPGRGAGIASASRTELPAALCHAALAVTAATAMLLTDTMWFHAYNVEVYAPSLGLTAAILLLAILAMRTGETRWKNLFMLAGGLALGMHVTCVMTFLVCLALLVVAGLAEHKKGLAGVCKSFAPGLLLMAMGSLVILYLPARAIQDPMRNWGGPDNVGALLAHLSGRSIRTSFTAQMLQFDWHHILTFGGTYVNQMVEQAGSLLPLSALGLGLAFRRHRLPTALLATLIAADAAFSILLNPMGQAEKQTSTISLFLIATTAGMGACFILSLVTESIARIAPRLVWPASGAATLALAAGLMWFPLASLSSEARGSRVASTAYQMACLGVHQLPPESLLVTGQDDMSALGLYMQEVEHRRPDSVHVVRQMLCTSSFLEPVLRRAPDGPVSQGLRAAHEGPCGSKAGRAGGPAQMVQGWRTVRDHLAANNVPFLLEIGDPAVDSLFAEAMTPGFPCFHVDYSLSNREREERIITSPASFDSEYRMLSQQGGLADDISANAIAEYARLFGAYLMNHGLAHGNQAVLHASCSVMRTAVELTPTNCHALNNFSVCLGTLGKLDHALGVARLATESCPLYPTAKVNLVRYILLRSTRTSLGEAQVQLTELVEVFDPVDYRLRLTRLSGQLRVLGLEEEAALVQKFLTDSGDD